MTRRELCSILGGLMTRFFAPRIKQVPTPHVAGTPHGTLMGLPIRVIEQDSALGTDGDIILGNFSWYSTARRRTPENGPATQA